MTVKYLEFVTSDVASTCETYEHVFGVSFGDEVPSLGMARTARLPSGTTLSVRAPLADHDEPITRTYLAVDDIDAAVAAAVAHGGMAAYGPTRQGDLGQFAIVILHGVQHGFWAP